MKMQRRMRRHIRLVVEERRIAFGARPRPTPPAGDVDATVEIPPLAGLARTPGATPSPLPAIGRVAVRSA